ncbi:MULTISPECIES: ImmA/IrrE family metallo-endopeptidase [unclassified Sphingobacterium]|uniref:ImmA/IrrE family metallo-endopeptidase n=1 Tax=unclassified Sphingobacterium TaxID=2609468 RepID=UPI0025F9C9AE|nr:MULTISPECIES: XRE family transcriptional regulator [unclassified Sphingobacterium]
MKNIDVDKLLQDIFNDDVSFDLKARFDEKIEEYGITKTKALKLLSIDKDVFEDIINGTAKQPNLIHVVKIAEFLEVNVDDFIQIVLKNQNTENITSIDRARKVRFLMKNFDVKALTKEGFFENIDDVDLLVERVLNYFGYDSIRSFEEELVTPLYSRIKRKFSDKMKDFWVRSAYQTFKLIDNPNEYDRERLKDVIVNMKPYSQDVKNGLYTVCRALYNIGVTVIFQDYLTTTQVKGATFIINGKPCIVLTDNPRKYPTIWFTLLHELHHVLFDYDAISTNRYHLSDDEDLFLIEEKANTFAREYFMSKSDFDYIKTYIKNSYVVERFAKDKEIHPSLVYSFYAWYQKDLYGKNYFGAFKEFYPDYRIAVSRLNPIAWNEESVRVVSEKIKAVFEIN